MAKRLPSLRCGPAKDITANLWPVPSQCIPKVISVVRIGNVLGADDDVSSRVKASRLEKKANFAVF